MADYWKSTPRYWCKHCKQYVRDTPIEKRNHESSSRHKGSLQRFLKDLHRSNEGEAREEQRAKDEVARLKGKSSGDDASHIPRSGHAGKPISVNHHNQPKASADERRKQMAQLAAMGVVIPHEFRKENAALGEWEDLSSKPAPNVAQQPLSRTLPSKAERDADQDPLLSTERVTVGKRKASEAEGDWLIRGRKKPNWGSDLKAHSTIEGDRDIQALFSNSSNIKFKSSKYDPHEESDTLQSTISSTAINDGSSEVKQRKDESDSMPLKSEPDDENSNPLVLNTSEENADVDYSTMFKKKRIRP